MAYVGLEHEDAAKGKFRRALALDPNLRLSGQQFPARVTRLFDEQVQALSAVRKKRTGRKLLILGGVGAAAAVGLSAGTSGGLPSNRSPTASIGVSPAGVVNAGVGRVAVLAGITQVRLVASAADPDGDALTYEWDFGDGVRGSGVNVTHVFGSEGTFWVSLRVNDGRGALGIAGVTVVAETLSGPWHYGQQQYQCIQSGASLDCTQTSRVPGRDNFFGWRGTLSDPRRVDLEILYESGEIDRCSGEVLQTPGLLSGRSVSGLDCILCGGLELGRRGGCQ